MALVSASNINNNTSEYKEYKEYKKYKKEYIERPIRLSISIDDTYFYDTLYNSYYNCHTKNTKNTKNTKYQTYISINGTVMLIEDCISYVNNINNTHNTYDRYSDKYTNNHFEFIDKCVLSISTHDCAHIYGRLLTDELLSILDDNKKKMIESEQFDMYLEYMAHIPLTFKSGKTYIIASGKLVIVHNTDPESENVTLFYDGKEFMKVDKNTLYFINKLIKFRYSIDFEKNNISATFIYDKDFRHKKDITVFYKSVEDLRDTGKLYKLVTHKQKVYKKNKNNKNEDREYKESFRSCVEYNSRTCDLNEIYYRDYHKQHNKLEGYYMYRHSTRKICDVAVYDMYDGDGDTTNSNSSELRYRGVYVSIKEQGKHLRTTLKKDEEIIYDKQGDGVTVDTIKRYEKDRDAIVIGWKVVKSESCEVRLLKLGIPVDAEIVSPIDTDFFFKRQKQRCSKAIVMDIQLPDPCNEISVVPEEMFAYSFVYENQEANSFVYNVGQEVVPDRFDNNDTETCASGIHFFANRKDAYDVYARE
jgi:hypothetical protein